MDQYSVGFDSFAGRVRLMVQRDDDAERALQIIREVDARAAARRTETGWRVSSNPRLRVARRRDGSGHRRRLSRHIRSPFGSLENRLVGNAAFPVARK